MIIQAQEVWQKLSDMNGDEWDTLLDVGETTSSNRDTDRHGSEFWDLLYQQRKENFYHGVEHLQSLRDRMINMLKYILLLGTFYIGLFQYGTVGLGLEPDLVMALPFILLVLSMIIFLQAYYILATQTLGPSKGNPKKAIQDGLQADQYRQVMVMTYSEWSGKNLELTKKAERRFAIGISVVFASLGSTATLFLLV